MDGLEKIDSEQKTEPQVSAKITDSTETKAQQNKRKREDAEPERPGPERTIPERPEPERKKTGVSEVIVILDDDDEKESSSTSASTHVFKIPEIPFWRRNTVKRMKTPPAIQRQRHPQPLVAQVQPNQRSVWPRMSRLNVALLGQSHRNAGTSLQQSLDNARRRPNQRVAVAQDQPNWGKGSSLSPRSQSDMAFQTRMNAVALAASQRRRKVMSSSQRNQPNVHSANLRNQQNGVALSASQSETNMTSSKRNQPNVQSADLQNRQNGEASSSSQSQTGMTSSNQKNQKSVPSTDVQNEEDQDVVFVSHTRRYRVRQVRENQQNTPVRDIPNQQSTVCQSPSSHVSSRPSENTENTVHASQQTQPRMGAGQSFLNQERQQSTPAWVHHSQNTQQNEFIPLLPVSLFQQNHQNVQNLIVHGHRISRLVPENRPNLVLQGQHVQPAPMLGGSPSIPGNLVHFNSWNRQPIVSQLLTPLAQFPANQMVFYETRQSVFIQSGEANRSRPLHQRHSQPLASHLLPQQQAANQSCPHLPCTGMQHVRPMGSHQNQVVPNEVLLLVPSGHQGELHPPPLPQLIPLYRAPQTGTFDGERM